MKPKTNPHSPDAALRLARQALAPSAQCRRRIDQGLAAAGVLLPAAVSGAAVAHAAAVTATSVGASGAAIVSGTSVTGTASVTAAAGGAAPTLAQGALVAAVGAGSTTTQALVTAVLLAVGAAGVATGVTVGVRALSRESPRATPSVHVSASVAPAVEASGSPEDSKSQAEVLALHGSAEPAATPPSAVTRSYQSAPPQRPTTPAAEVFTQHGAVPRQVAPLVSSVDSASALIDLELAGVRETHAALARGDGVLAQQLLSDLERTVPAGALEPERRVCAVLAACQLQQHRRALQLATQLLTSDGDFYRQRLAASCLSALLSDPGLGPGPTSRQSPANEPEIETQFPKKPFAGN